MSKKHLTDRSQAEAFAQRTRCNLEFIEEAGRDSVNDVHRVTQITLSLLGVIVFPWERETLDSAMQATSLADLDVQGWPRWKITLDEGEQKTLTLGRLMYHLRNATSHGRLRFNSDSPEPREVMVFAEDVKPRQEQPYWCAEIQADQLREFCIRVLSLYENCVN